MVGNLRPTGATDPEVKRLHDAAREALRGQKAYLSAKAIQVTLAAGATTIPHRLGRNPKGWLLHTIVGSSDVRVASAGDVDAENIKLTSTAVGSCVLEVW